jgi:hypothetical protein
MLRHARAIIRFVSFDTLFHASLILILNQDEQTVSFIFGPFLPRRMMHQMEARFMQAVLNRPIFIPWTLMSASQRKLKMGNEAKGSGDK